MSFCPSEDPWILFIVIRLSSLALVQTWFVADEYWQATEIGHYMAFGFSSHMAFTDIYLASYGYQTWEWQHGIRSAVYPAIFGCLFKILGILRLDYPLLLTELPRVIHALTFSVGDYHMWKLSRKLYNQDTANWSAVCLSSSWFLEYCSPRTLTSSAETVLSSIALWHYPWKNERENCSTQYLWLVGIACVIRPTAALLFLPLCLGHLWKSRYKWVLFLKYVVIICIVLLVSVTIDSWYYGKLILVPWNFVHFNIISGLSSHYGTHPWHWYLTQGIPVTLTTHLLPFILAIIYYPARHKALLPLCLWCIFTYSCLSHKEFRFLLPVLPLCLIIAADYLALNLSSHKKKSELSGTRRSVVVLITLILPNLVAILYLGLIHQRGPLDTMEALQQEITSAEDPNILFLMPCHSTPYYSHLHKEVPLRFLTCEPNLKHQENYEDEADIFEKNPLAWLNQEYFPKGEQDLKESNKHINGPENEYGKFDRDQLSLPSHIVLFDILLEKVQSFLTDHSYHLCHKLFNSHVVDGRRSRFILIYCK